MFQKLIYTFTLLIFTSCLVFSQNDTIKPINQKIRNLQTTKDTAHKTNNIVIEKKDTIKTSLDSIVVVDNKDTISHEKDGVVISKNAIKTRIDYQAIDSIRFDVKNKRTYLYFKANINYEDLHLESDYVEIDMQKGEIHAQGASDSVGVIKGKPIFKQGEQEFKTEKMSYNFNTKKGVIYSVITQEGEGFMHGTKIKKYQDNTTFVESGKYTTCDETCPHFELAFQKAKVIPDNKIITGPAYLKIEGIPTPLAIPFGYFPNKKGRASGIIVPSYGESANRGFYFENGGFYWGVNDNLDISFLGDIYTRGSWAGKIRSNYIKRYKFKGNLDLAYAQNKIGEINTLEYQRSNDFMFRWSHQQDPKAHPVRRFSADVNILSNQFSKFNPTSANDYLSNTFQSGISYSTTFNSKYNLSANIRHSQNTITRQVDMSLPEVNFSVNRFYPLRKKIRQGNLKWYENISMSYQTNLRNKITTIDTLLFTSNVFDKMQNGIKHSIPINSSIKVLKFFSWNNSANYTERWYTKTIEKNWYNSIYNNDTVPNYIKTDYINGFTAARDFNFSSSLTTKLYGLIQFKKGKIKAFRHVVTPTLNYSYNPNFGSQKWGYYKYYLDQYGNKQRYSIFENSLYGSPPGQESSLINFSLANNIEAKIRSRKDSSEYKKVIIIENLSLSTAYNFALDSLQWIPLVINGRSTLFKNLYVTYNSVWDPYSLSENGKRNSQLEITKNKKLFRRTSTDWNFSLNLAINQELFDKLINKSDPKATEKTTTTSSSQNQSQKWNFNINYNLYYFNRLNPQLLGFEDDVTQTIGLQGEFHLTPKWKINLMTNYDFKNKDFTYSSIDIYRDLHCWEMHFNWIPFGFRKSWNFSINVKASVLQDLKYILKKDFRDAL